LITLSTLISFRRTVPLIKNNVMENYRGLSGRHSLEFIFDPMPHHRRTRLVTRRYLVEFEINFENIAGSQSMAKRGSRLIKKI
jgi:hypothetical protein